MPGELPHFVKTTKPVPVPAPVILCTSCGLRPATRGDLCATCYKDAHPATPKAKPAAAPVPVKRLTPSVLADAVLAEPKSHTGISELQRVIRRNGKTGTSEMNALLDVIARLRAEGFEF